jgi:phenylalanyl-tRNA synthetase beta chain
MKISLNWLSEFVDLPEDVDALVAMLDDLGLVVEGREVVGEGLDKVIVARVVEIHSIEGADKVRRVMVDSGRDELVQIVCGAMNFVEGDHVPLAPVGAVLPGNFAIAARKMRGVLSDGMLCSGRELGLGDDHGGLLILDRGTRPGDALMDALGIAADVIVDISPEGNRPDAWSVEGVARDIAARSGKTLKSVTLAEPQRALNATEKVAGVITDQTLAPRLTVGYVDQVQVGPSPQLVQQRLTAAGMRPINNVVDASNYVMLELGQPTHAYDADRLARRTLMVRRAQEGEVLVTLDGVSRELGRAGRGLGDTGVDIVITDGDDRVVGLAGIMGGQDTEIHDGSTHLVFEAATFNPMAIARSSKRHGLRSEASARFERGVDSELALRAAARFVEVLSWSSPNLRWYDQSIDCRGESVERSRVELRSGDVSALLGTEISASQIEAILTALDFSVETRDDGWWVTAPSRRVDIRPGVAGRADIIEEIARLYGYRQLLRRAPSWPDRGALSARRRVERDVRALLSGVGLSEAWTATLVSESDFSRWNDDSTSRITVTNPLSNDESIFRSSLVGGLVDAVARNAERSAAVGFFEIGVTADHPRHNGSPRRERGGVGGASIVELPTETNRLAVALAREGDDVTSVVRVIHVLAARMGLSRVELRDGVVPRGWHPTRTARIVDASTGVELGVVGECDPAVIADVAPHFPERQRIALAEISLEAWSAAEKRSVHVSVPSRFPSARFDLALVSPDSISRYQLESTLRDAHPLVSQVTFFDAYRGPEQPVGSSERSLAFHIELTSPERTLTDGDISAAREALLSAAELVGSRLR